MIHHMRMSNDILNGGNSLYEVKSEKPFLRVATCFKYYLCRGGMGEHQFSISISDTVDVGNNISAFLRKHTHVVIDRDEASLSLDACFV